MIFFYIIQFAPRDELNRRVLGYLFGELIKRLKKRTVVSHSMKIETAYRIKKIKRNEKIITNKSIDGNK